MTDAEVMTIIRRRMAYVENELAIDTPATAAQFSAQMTAYAEELAAGLKKPPINVDVPYLGGVGTVGEALTITDGNWQNEPTSYGYAWHSNGAYVGDGTASYTVVESDVGATIGCVVGATNASGSTDAPMSNTVIGAAGAARSTARHEEERAPARDSHSDARRK